MQSGVFFNKRPLNSSEISVFEDAIGVPTLEDGEYWYDADSGLWGAVGGPAMGTLTPHLPVPFPPGVIQGSWASGHGTDIWVNGREIHWMDQQQLALPCEDPGSRYVIDANGRIRPEAQSASTTPDEPTLKVKASLNVRPRHSAAVKVVQSLQKWKMGGEQIIEYVVLHISYGELEWKTSDTFEQFTKMHQFIKKHYQSLQLPSFPGKGLRKKRTTEVIVARQEKLEHYLNFIFNVRTVRENVRVLAIVGLYDPIILPRSSKYPTMPSFGLGGESSENPLALLMQTQRQCIATLYVALARKDGWDRPAATSVVLQAALDRLVLTEDMINTALDLLGRIDQENVDSYLTHVSGQALAGLDETARWCILWELLLQSLKAGCLDSRIHVSIHRLATLLCISLDKITAIESECAEFLQEKLMEKQNPDKSKGRSSTRNVKMAAGAAIGGGVLLAAGIIAAPLIIPAVVGGAAFVAGAVPLLGLGAAVTAGGSIMAVVATPTLPLLFGAAGAGLGSYKVHRLTGDVKEFAFVPVPKEVCDEEGVPLQEEEKDISEPWSVDWENKDIVCDKKLDDNTSDLPKVPPTATPPRPQATPPRPQATATPPRPHGTPPPIDRSTKGVRPPSSLSNEVSSPSGLELALPSVPSTPPHVSSDLALPSVPPRLPPRSHQHQLVVMNQSEDLVQRNPNGSTSPSLSKRASVVLERTRVSLTSSSNSLRTSISSFEVFDYKPKVDHSHTGMRVCICVNGWVWNKQEFTSNWVKIRELDSSMETYGLRWESEELQNLGRSLVKVMTKTLAMQMAKLWIISASAVAAGVLSAFAWPAAAVALSSAIDNPWSVVASRAKKAGKLLGDTLLERAQGNRPVTLIGYSLGARVVFSALKYLEEQGERGRGIVENVFLLGAACTIDADEWTRLRRVVAGRLVNAYTKADWVLAFVHRAAGTSLKVAGLGPIQCHGVENVDLSSFVGGHLSYKSNLPKILEYLHVTESNYTVPQEVPQPEALPYATLEQLTGPEATPQPAGMHRALPGIPPIPPRPAPGAFDDELD